MVEKIPEHKILDKLLTLKKYETSGNISVISHQFGFNFNYDDFPNDFHLRIFLQSILVHHFLQIVSNKTRRGSIRIIINITCPYSESTATVHTERIFSTDESIRRKTCTYNQKNLNFPLDKIICRRHCIFQNRYPPTSKREIICIWY